MPNKMWTYSQSTGELIAPNGEVVSIGYSGAGPDKNNPTDENVKNMGPIPEGEYTIDAPVDSPKHGPFALPLLPDPGNEMFGRDEFLIHGDSLEHPGAASEGCIIQARTAREMVWNSGDHRLQVVRGLSTTI